MKTIVITGFGALTPLGATAPETWQAMLAGRSGAHHLTEEWAQNLPVTFAAHAAQEPTEKVDRVQARRMDRASQLALVAGLEAWADAGFGLGEDNPVDPERLSVSCATGIGGLHSLLDQWDIQRDKGQRRVSPFAIPMLMPNAPAANLGLKVNARASVRTTVSACASSNEAIAQAVDTINLDRADVVLAGGTEAVIHPMPLNAFAQMRALSTRNDDPERASRPWDVDRDGFVLAEGACLMVLESLEYATARGAKIYGTVAGAGLSADSHDLVQPDPSGHGQASAVTRALHESQLSPRDIVHVNAHGTSTPQGDTTEAHSIRQALGSDADHVVVTSTKSMTGHLLGGAGALETFASVMALNTRTVPATINVEHLEAGLPVQVALTNTELPSGDLAALNNSFGFGGHNVAVAVTNANQSRTLPTTNESPTPSA